MIDKYERYEVYFTNEAEMFKERTRLWKDGWVVNEKQFYNIEGKSVIFMLQAMRSQKGGS